MSCIYTILLKPLSLRHSVQCPISGPLLMALFFPVWNILLFLCISKYYFSFKVQIKCYLHLKATYVAATTWRVREGSDDLIYNYLFMWLLFPQTLTSSRAETAPYAVLQS